MKSSGIRGQAVLEGVMMRNRSEYAVAVRKPDGEIQVTRGKCKSLAERSLFFRLPLIRGVVKFVEALMLGVRTLTFSASFYEQEEEKREEASAKKNDFKERLKTAFTVLISLVAAVLAFVVLPYAASRMLCARIESVSKLTVAEGIIRAVLFIGYIIVLSFMNDIHRLFRYHGAEHKVINCIENGLELTVGNARRQSKHLRKCGTSFVFAVIFISIILFMFIQFENMWLRIALRVILVPVVAGICYEFVVFTSDSKNKIVGILCKPGMLFQLLTTREPDSKMLEVAIASVEEVFDWREYQRRCIGVRRNREKMERLHRVGRHRESPEEIRQREESEKWENERKKRLNEQERKELELEKIADEAAKRKAKEKALKERMAGEAAGTREVSLETLNRYLDDEKNRKDPAAGR